MIKTLRIISILVVALAAILLLVFSVVIFGVRGDTDIEDLLGEPDVIEKFNNSAGNKATRGTSQISPLVQQAGAFALYLNPPKPKAPRPVKGRPSSVKRAPSATPKFKVMGTSYYKGRPELSLAFIDEPGKGLHWVRQSSMVGHLLIKEVRDGVVVVKDNNGTFEIKAEEEPHVSLLEGAPAVPSKKASVSRRPMPRPVPRSSAAASVKPSTGFSGKTGSRIVKPPRPPLPRKTNEKESIMGELATEMTTLQRKIKSGTFTDQERAAMMKELVDNFEKLRSEDFSKEDKESIGILGKELKKVMEEPTTSGQK